MVVLLIEIGKSGGGAGLGLEDECVLRHVEADLLLGGHLGQEPVQLGKFSTCKNTSDRQQPPYQNQIRKPGVPRVSQPLTRPEAAGLVRPQSVPQAQVQVPH